MDKLTHYAVAPELAGHATGRATDVVHDEKEVRTLTSSMDFRDVRYRREVFTRFYLFHLMYRAHPGCVYYLMPHLFGEVGAGDREDKLWYAFVNGCTQHPVTSLVIFREFPRMPRTDVQVKWLTEWFNEEWARLPFDTDRRYQKREVPAAVDAYRRWVGDSTQDNAWAAHCVDRDPTINFDACWRVARTQLKGFGRLGSWSYLEYLFVMGSPLEPSSMMLRDMDGSKSHRNGLAKVLGRDDLDWVKGGPFQGKYSTQVLEWLEREADLLLEEARRAAETWNRTRGLRGADVDLRHVSRFTLESALCTFKGWFRPNRRYPNVYNDMLRDRIRHVETLRPGEDFSVFWDARRKYLPTELRVEDSPGDPGLARPKQNHFRETGRVPMMGLVWDVFQDRDETWRTK